MTFKYNTRRNQVKWWFEDKAWWVKAKLTGVCYICGLRGTHKMDCDGRNWGPDE